MLNAVCYRPEQGWSEVQDFTHVSDLVGDDGVLLWARGDVDDLTAENIRQIADELALSPYAVEDALNTRQRPKLEAYETHLFAVMHQLDEIEGQLEALQIACFVGPRWVLTVHDGAERTMAETLRRLEASEKEPAQGPSFIMHTLLDTIVDDYEATTNRIEEQIETLEEVVLQSPRTTVQRQLYSLKQRLSRLRRYAMPGERVLAEVLSPGRYDLITQRTAERFRDVHDHLLRILDQIRNVDDLANAMIELQRSEQANALNEVTKRLTGWAAIIAVPTFIASVYGMNFALVPDEGQIKGFYFALTLMAFSGVGLYAFFKKRDWI